MSLTFLDLQNEVKERATRNQGGTTFDTATKNAINTSLFRLSRECPWKQLRRKTHFLTDAPYTTGSGSVSVTEDNGTVTVTGATFITNNIKVGRRVDLGGSSSKYSIGSITGETTFTLADSKTYDGTTSTTQTYKIYGTEEYNLPIQAGRIALVWHEDYGYPYPLSYVTDTDFIEAGIDIDTDGTPTHYRQWGEDCVIEQPYAASVLRVTSSSASDTSKSITVFGTVSGYPDYETITTNASDGTTAVSGTKSFTSIERVVKDSSTVGRITVDSNSANVTVAVLPVGDATDRKSTRLNSSH